MVRAAKFADVTAMFDLIVSAHKKSVYADNLVINDQAAKQMLVRCINRHGHTNDGGCLVMVSETEGKVNGFIIGYLDTVYPFVEQLRATDLLFIMGDDAPASDSIRMIKAIEGWAKKIDLVVEVLFGVTDVLVDSDRAGALYERAGNAVFGKFYRKGISHEQRSKSSKEKVQEGHKLH